MTEMNKLEISLFQNFEVRKVLYRDERYFPIQDIVFVLTESKNVMDYIKKLRIRDEELGKGWGQIVTPLWIDTRGGRQKLNCTNTKGALRILQSIPSPKAEPFKQRLAGLGNERIDEINNPELGIQRAKARAIEIWKNQGHDEKWIAKRLQSIDTRNSFTDILKERGVKEGFEEVQEAVTFGSEIVGIARESIERKIGKKVISEENYLTNKQKGQRKCLDKK